MTHFECTIHEAATTVRVEVVQTERQGSMDTRKLEERLFIRRYRARIPNFVKELLAKKQFSFCPIDIMAKSFTAGGIYRLRYEFGYDDIRGVTFQTFLKRVTRWRIISANINVQLNPATKKISLAVTIKVLKPTDVGRTVNLHPIRNELEDVEVRKMGGTY